MMRPELNYQFNNYKAFLFDLNGTMINDMPYHINAWHLILNELGANISLERTKQECYGKNHELLERIFPGRFTLDEKDKLSYEKEKQYQAEFRPHLQLLNGLEVFIKQLQTRGFKLAIGSAAIMYNIDFVLDGLNIRKYFDVLVSADDVAHSKPDPETWLMCAERLNVDPDNCLVFEDSPKGVESALNARMDCMVLTTMHPVEDFKFYSNIIAYMEDFSQISAGQFR